MYVLLECPLSRNRSEALLEFCLGRGVDCFAASFFATEEHRERTDDFMARFAPFTLGTRPLERTVVYEGQSRFAQRERWSLNRRSAELILDACGGSLAAYEFGRFPEDWTFYRGSELLVGVVSHERYAFARASDDDLERFDALGLRYVHPE